jgi:hypothetical protein
MNEKNRPDPSPQNDFEPPAALTAEHWRRVKQIFDQVNEAQPEQREALLAEACAADAGLRHDRRRASLLRHGVHRRRTD